MKKTILKSLLVYSMLICTQMVNAQANYDQDYESAKATVKKVAKDFSLSWNKTKWFFGGMDHTNWYVKYENGLVVWNNFRSYRTSQEVINYYTGKTPGDCDAWYYKKGKRYNLCYTSDQVKRYRKSFGQIVDMGFTNKQGNTSSLFQLVPQPVEKKKRDDSKAKKESKPNGKILPDRDSKTPAKSEISESH